jgi:murein DD-endopeptidase MepM/ murein hydrolase activator NlpD
MSKKYSFIILSNCGSSSRQITTSVYFITSVALVLMVALGALAYISYDYYKLKKSVALTKTLQSKITTQGEEINVQQRQIEKFTDEINSLKDRLVQLDNFEKKIRIIANINIPEDQDNLFGVGGSIPEDLDPGAELTRKHNNLLRAMHEQVDTLNLASYTKEKSFETLLKHLEKQRNILASTPAIRPCKGWYTSNFGYRKSPFTGQREFHKGVDISNRKGTPIVATANGRVSYVGDKGLLGKTVVINHGHGMITRYAHIDKALKKRGEKVKRGDIIAQVGNTGRSTGPHLHYEVHLNGVPVNPKKYILD